MCFRTTIRARTMCALIFLWEVDYLALSKFVELVQGRLDRLPLCFQLVQTNAQRSKSNMSHDLHQPNGFAAVRRLAFSLLLGVLRVQSYLHRLVGHRHVAVIRDESPMYV